MLGEKINFWQILKNAVWWSSANKGNTQFPANWQTNQHIHTNNFVQKQNKKGNKQTQTNKIQTIELTNKQWKKPSKLTITSEIIWIWFRFSVSLSTDTNTSLTYLRILITIRVFTWGWKTNKQTNKNISETILMQASYVKNTFQYVNLTSYEQINRTWKNGKSIDTVYQYK